MTVVIALLLLLIAVHFLGHQGGSAAPAAVKVRVEPPESPRS